MKILHRNSQAKSLAIKSQHFLIHLFSEFRNDRCPEKAASLAYTSLLALVPLLTVMEFTFSSFQAFNTWRTGLIDLIFENLIPELGDQLRYYLMIFSQNAAGLRAAGLAILIATALSVMSTIEASLNLIWKVRSKRPVVVRLLLYWAILTLGPLFLGLGIFTSSFLFSIILSEAPTQNALISGIFLTMLPLALTTTSFSLLFYLVPNRPVIIRDAFIGGFIAAIFFEIAKNCITLFIALFPSQQIIYGAFSIIPIFFIWVYISWLIILLGAEISKCVDSFNIDRYPKETTNKPLNLLYCQIKILGILHANQRDGEVISERELKAKLKTFSNNIFFESLNGLLDASWIARNDKHNWMIIHSLDNLYFDDLLKLTPCFPSAGEVDQLTDSKTDSEISKLLYNIGGKSNRNSELSLTELFISSN